MSTTFIPAKVILLNKLREAPKGIHLVCFGVDRLGDLIRHSLPTGIAIRDKFTRVGSPAELIFTLRVLAHQIRSTHLVMTSAFQRFCSQSQ